MPPAGTAASRHGLHDLQIGPSETENRKKISAKCHFFLTLELVRLINAFVSAERRQKLLPTGTQRRCKRSAADIRGANSLLMSASNELELGPDHPRPVCDLALWNKIVDRATSRRAERLSQAVGWEGFSPG